MFVRVGGVVQARHMAAFEHGISVDQADFYSRFGCRCVSLFITHAGAVIMHGGPVRRY